MVELNSTDAKKLWCINYDCLQPVLSYPGICISIWTQ